MRQLSADEVKRLWETLEEKWDIKPYYYWYPLTEHSYPDDVAISLDAEAFEKEFGFARLRDIFKARGIEKVIWLTECGYKEKDSEIDISDFEPEYDGGEGFWCNLEAEWIIYASHEVSITFAGKWLVEEIKNNYPKWNERLWIDMEFC